MTGFDPDWTVAPAATVADLMRERDLTVHMMAEAVSDHQDKAARMIQEVLDREPLGLEHAVILSAATGVSVQFWLNYERLYREALAAGRKDVTRDAPGLGGPDEENRTT